jgi:hypothetical protein
VEHDTSSGANTKWVVQDEPPRKKERKRGRCPVAPLIGYTFNKKNHEFNGVYTVFF